MPFMPPLKPSQPQPKAKRYTGTKTRIRKMSTSGRDRFAKPARASSPNRQYR